MLEAPRHLDEGILNKVGIINPIGEETAMRSPCEDTDIRTDRFKESAESGLVPVSGLTKQLVGRRRLHHNTRGKEPTGKVTRVGDLSHHIFQIF